MPAIEKTPSTAQTIRPQRGKGFFVSLLNWKIAWINVLIARLHFKKSRKSGIRQQQRGPAFTYIADAATHDAYRRRRPNP